jgi:hypothetical protein
MFGFTKVDVERGLSALGHLSAEERVAALEFATESFNGYLYDSAPLALWLYNPQLCLKFFRILCTKEGPVAVRAWQSGAKTTQEILRFVDDPNVQISESALKILSRSPLTLTDQETLVGRGRIECTLSDVREVFKLEEMLQRPTGGNQGQNDKQRARMLAFMFAHGIVTFASRAEIPADGDFDKVALVAPNEMVREKLLESLGKRLELDSSDAFGAFGEPTDEKIEKYLNGLFRSVQTSMGNDVSEPAVQGIVETKLCGENVLTAASLRAFFVKSRPAALSSLLNLECMI